MAPANSMRMSIIPASEIDDGCAVAWNALRAGQPVLDSPFYAPEFARIVGSVRRDAWISIVEDGGRIVGFFPHHCVRGGVGKPIGGHLNDYHGPVLAPQCGISLADLIGRAGMRVYDFDHLPQQMSGGEVSRGGLTQSPQMDLSQGYEACVSRKNGSWKRGSSDMRRKLRKMERELGPVRFTYADSSDDTFERHVRMRNALYRKMGQRDDYCRGWEGRVLRKLREVRSPEFSSVMSTLHAGDKLVAAHFGLVSRGVLHWWFPAYDLAAHHYSPGLNLVNCCAMEAAQRGIRTIDFGRGRDRYKLLFADRFENLCAGSFVSGMSLASTTRIALANVCRIAERLFSAGAQDVLDRAASRLVWGSTLPTAISN